MLAKYILAVLGAGFLLAAALRRGRSPQSPIWLLVGTIFVAVSLWLFTRP